MFPLFMFFFLPKVACVPGKYIIFTIRVKMKARSRLTMCNCGDFNNYHLHALRLSKASSS